MKKSSFIVVATSQDVKFSIDHQTFTVLIEHDAERTRLERNRWFARQLRTALKRLQRGGIP